MINILGTIEKKLNSKKTENENYNYLLQKTTTFKNLLPIPELTNEESKYKVHYITKNCPDINKEKAILITKLIPIDETYLSVFYTKEVLTNQEFFLIPTNKYLWIINQKNYAAFYYKGLNCSIIKNNLMSKIINLNNILIEIKGKDENI